ncbi:MAG TPA: hypothetical protein VGG72_19955 [Bryobacteraceae bacterium]|jgi:hypothetical protein
MGDNSKKLSNTEVSAEQAVAIDEASYRVALTLSHRRAEAAVEQERWRMDNPSSSRRDAPLASETPFAPARVFQRVKAALSRSL